MHSTNSYELKVVGLFGELLAWHRIQATKGCSNSCRKSRKQWSCRPLKDSSRNPPRFRPIFRPFHRIRSRHNTFIFSRFILGVRCQSAPPSTFLGAATAPSWESWLVPRNNLQDMCARKNSCWAKQWRPRIAPPPA